MKKGAVLLLAAGVFAVCVGLVIQTASPATWTTVYFALSRQWVRLWPFDRGKLLMVVGYSRFGPFTPVWLQVEPRIEMRLDPADLVSRVILGTGSWELSSWRAIQPHLKPGATFIDVGAHIGYYSLKAAAVVGPSGHVFAIEPNPETLRTLRENVAASAASAVVVYPVAAYDSETTLDFFAAPRANTGESSLSRKNASQEHPATQSYRVRARRLDDIVRESGVSGVDAIKIDVEGAEYAVLKGADVTLTRFRPAIVLIEIIDRQLRELGATSEDVLTFMRAHGYTVHHTYDQINFEFGLDTRFATQ